MGERTVHEPYGEMDTKPEGLRMRASDIGLKAQLPQTILLHPSCQADSAKEACTRDK